MSETNGVILGTAVFSAMIVFCGVNFIAWASNDLYYLNTNNNKVVAKYDANTFKTYSCIRVQKIIK